MVLGKPIIYLAADKIEEYNSADRTYNNRYPSEYLNGLDPLGLLPFKLKFEIGYPIILIRNLAPKD
ncbi:hypothetical protein GIB67_003667 [Kingdonia uniflora]|uniref:ATP-dependent DNA helicase n=1 Tax=Kingdonia uniflora TaxID=39325 RepID=A0A7J7M3S8_9MAGN|nr:hypothetical protein GIB67_003667 [Kingdonia uniflora]